MKFEVLLQKMRDRLCFRAEDLHLGQEPSDHEWVQLSLWARDGKLQRLKKGIYTLAPEFRRQPVMAISLAEPLYRPSYLSLEYALSRYGMIPEAVGTFTSVSTLKTAVFRNDLGTFSYRHVSPDSFFGFHRETKPAPHFLAMPEKAILDFIHLSIPRSRPLTEALLVEGYRIQNLGILRKRRLLEAMARFRVPRVQQGGKLILALMEARHD
jgi:hypothetical protein